MASSHHRRQSSDATLIAQPPLRRGHHRRDSSDATLMNPTQGLGSVTIPEKAFSSEKKLWNPADILERHTSDRQTASTGRPRSHNLHARYQTSDILGLNTTSHKGFDVNTNEDTREHRLSHRAGEENLRSRRGSFLGKRPEDALVLPKRDMMDEKGEGSQRRSFQASVQSVVDSEEGGRSLRNVR